MASIYRFFRTFCNHVLWPSRRVLVLMIGMLDRLCLSVSDILRVTLVACVQRTSRESFAFVCAAARRPRRVIAVRQSYTTIGPLQPGVMDLGYSTSGGGGRQGLLVVYGLVDSPGAG